MNDLKIFSGTANQALAKRITDYLGVPLGDIALGQLPRRRNLLQDQRRHPRPRRVSHSADLPAGE